MTKTLRSPEINPTLYVQEISCNTPTTQTLVFIHGWGMHSGIWAQIVSALEANYNCLLVDLPGMGRSPIANGDYTLATVSAQVLEALSPWASEHFHWIGWSLGALVAARCAQLSPQSKSLSIVSMGPSFIEAANEPQATALALERISPKLFNKFKALLQEDYEGTLFRFLGLNTKGSIHQKAEIRLLQQLVFTYGIPAQKAMREGLNILERENLLETLNNPTLPVQVILGEQDALVPVQQGLWIQKNCPSIKAHIIEGAGHIPFLSRSALFLEQLESFLLEQTL